MLLPDLEEQVVGKLGRRHRREVVVVAGERLQCADEMHRGGLAELEHAFAVVAADVRIRVAGRGIHVAVRVDRDTTRRPDRTLPARPAVRRDVERDLAGTRNRERHQPAVVRAAIAEVSAVPDVDATVRERETGALLDVERTLHATGIGIHRDARDARERVETEELMVNVAERALDRRDHVDAAVRRVDHRRRQDPERIDVAAAGLRGHVGHRRTEMTLPQHGSVMGIERVHGVVLGRRVHAPVEHERLPVHRPVERGRPRFVQRAQR